MFSLLLAQVSNGDGSDAAGAAAVMGVIFVLFMVVLELALIAAIIAGMWKVFEKAGEPGWAAIVPVYNFIILLKIVGKPWWWVFLMFVPIVSLVIYIMVAVEVSKVFGQSAGFTIGLVFLPMVFFPILGFGKAQYLGLQQGSQFGFPVTGQPQALPPQY